MWARRTYTADLFIENYCVYCRVLGAMLGSVHLVNPLAICWKDVLVKICTALDIVPDAKEQALICECREELAVRHCGL